MVFQMAKEKEEEKTESVKSKTAVSSPSSSSSGVSTTTISDKMDPEKEKALLESFVKGSGSSNVEIIFSFDTTGSMASCLGQVREKVSETVSRLMKDIPNIRIGIIAHGDYCDDQGSGPTISKLDFIDKTGVDKIVQFVKTVGATGGGDAPEAYELALREAKGFSWTEGYSKALVIIGDEVPHPPSYTTENINWWKEMEELAAKGVKIYGVRALHNEYAKAFYEELSARTGTVSIHFNNFKLIVDMFLAICYREASSVQLEVFKEEVKAEGKMTKELESVFDTLEQPNPEMEKKPERKFDLKDPWYAIENDKETRPSYMRGENGKWVPYKDNWQQTKSSDSKKSKSKKKR